MQCIVCNANVKLGQIKFRYLYFCMSIMIQIFVVCCYHINQSFNRIYSIHTRMNWVLRVTRDRRKTNYNWVKIIINWITLIAAKTVQFPGASVAAVCQVYCNSTEGGDCEDCGHWGAHSLVYIMDTWSVLEKENYGHSIIMEVINCYCRL